MPTVFHGVQDLLAATGDHPFVRSSLRHRNRDVRGWTDHSAVVWTARDDRPDRDAESVVGLGPAAAVVELLAAVAHLLPVAGTLTVPRDAEAEVPAALGFTGRSRWDFRATSTPPPPVPGLDAVGPLPAAEYPNAADLLDRANPTASVRPGSPSARLWAAARDRAGRLVALAADTSGRGVGHTSAVGTDPAARGRGFGAAVTCWLARRQVAEFGIATLGFYADNEPARRLYDRLGYGQGLALTSGTFSRQCPPGQ